VKHLLGVLMVLSDRPHPSQVQVASRLGEDPTEEMAGIQAQPKGRQRHQRALRKLILQLRENTALRMDQS
jgi:hypothetical protein